MKNIQIDDEKATVIILVTLIISLLSIYIYIEVFNKRVDVYIVDNNNNEETNNGSEEPNNNNTDGIVIQKESIKYENMVTKLVTKVTNNGENLQNIRYKVKLVAQDDNVLKELNLFVGDISKEQTKYVDSYIDGDVTNIKDVIYEVVK